MKVENFDASLLSLKKIEEFKNTIENNRNNQIGLLLNLSNSELKNIYIMVKVIIENIFFYKFLNFKILHNFH